ncbi:MAG: hypothetical protein NC389_06915 [Acetatifactor muris]|nr:hypothetical protein [Acetatifactor muris]
MAERRKKKHILLKIFLVLLLLLLAAAAGLAIYLYPAYRASGYLAEHLDIGKTDYTLEIRLDRGELSGKSRLIIDTLAEITGITGQELCHLTIQGTVDEDIIYARIYSEGREKPLTELYLSDGRDVVNGAMLYDAMRENFCSQNALLEYLFPVWEEHKYMSLKQAEDMFGVDLSVLRDFRLPLEKLRLSRLKCFGILALMHRDKGASGESFSLRMNGMDIAIYLQDPIECSLEAESPADAFNTLQKLGKKLSGAGIHLGMDGIDGDKLRILESLSVRLEMNEEDVTLRVPEDLISQNMVDIVKGIRVVIRELSGK